jgi:hypothetical protein
MLMEFSRMKKSSLSMLGGVVSVAALAISGCHSIPAASDAGNHSEFPPICSAYIDRVQACVGKVAGARDPAQVENARRTLESRILEYGRTHSRSDLVQTCTQAWNHFSQTASSYGCN